jgi:hypothetical protein
MPSRHIKCTCTNCAAIFRMAQTNIDRGVSRGGLVCPICIGAVVVGDVELTAGQRKQIEELCAEVAEDAAKPLNEAELQRRKEMFEKRRVHAGRNCGSVHTHEGGAD